MPKIKALHAAIFGAGTVNFIFKPRVDLALLAIAKCCAQQDNAVAFTKPETFSRLIEMGTLHMSLKSAKLIGLH